jgi:tetratricopeptide (TPR) repeat protein
MRARLRLSKLLPTTVILSGLLLSLATSARGDQQDQRLNLAFAQLAKASSPQGVRVLESRIWKIWLEHPQPRINEMMRWGVEALNTQDYPTALKLFDSLVEAAPEFAEGWNKRATVRFLVGNYEGSIEDIRKTLALEPRHFGALSGLGMIHTNQERWFAAMAAFEQALRIHPHLIGVRHTINKLQQQLRKEST